MEFKDKLKELRKQNNMTQDALAFEIHVSRSTIAKWEAGLGLPQKDSIENLCVYFKIREDELISSNYKEETLVSKNLQIHSFKKRVLRLSIIFGFITVLMIVFTCIKISNMQDIINKDDIYTSIQLINHADSHLKKVSYAGKISSNENLLNYKYGYSYQIVEFEKIKYTDKSSLVLIKVSNTFVPGVVAFQNGSTEFEKKSELNFSFTEISFNDNVNILYSWPNLEKKWVTINSLYSTNIIYDFSLSFSEIHFQKINDQLQFYYSGSFDDIVLSNDKTEIIRNFNYNSNKKSAKWSYEMHDFAKNASFNMYSYYLVEVNEDNSSSFEFNILTGMNNGKHTINRNHNIICYF